MARRRRRRACAALVLAAAAAAAAGTAGCGTGLGPGTGGGGGRGASGGSGAGGDQPAGGRPLTVGMLLSIAAGYGQMGADVGDGVRLYVAQHHGRLGGRPVTLDTSIEGTTAGDAGAGFQRLLHDGAQAVIGPIGGMSFQAVAPAANSVHVPLVGVVARPDMADIRYIWNVAFMSTDPGTAIAPYIYEHIKGSVFAIGGNYPGGWEQIRGFADYFTSLGGKLANASGRPEFTSVPDTVDFSGYLAAIQASGAKAVYCSFTGQEAVRFVHQYAASAVRNIPLFAAGFVTDGPLLTEEGQSAAGITSVLDYSPDVDTAANRAFVAAWSDGHDGEQPSIYALTGYDAAALLDEAVAKAGPDAGAEAINAAIATLGRIDSPRGAWQLATATHAPIQKWYLRRVQTDGTTLANVETQELATLPD